MLPPSRSSALVFCRFAVGIVERSSSSGSVSMPIAKALASGFSELISDFGLLVLSFSSFFQYSDFTSLFFRISFSGQYLCSH